MIVCEKQKYKKEEKILIECDFKTSTKCKGRYLKLYKNILLCRENNNGKDRCCYCFNTITKTGRDNFNFKREKDENFFRNIDSELKAYLLGFVAGDGTIFQYNLSLENHIDDISVLELFKTRVAPGSEFYKHSDPIRGANTIRLTIHSVKIVQDLIKHLKLSGHGKKSYKICLPDLPEELLWVFIRGLFDSDGFVSSPLKRTSPRAGIASMSQQIKKEISDLCERYNIKHYIDNVQIIFSGKNSLLFMDKIYSGATFYLPRKYEKWLIWKTWEPNKGTIIRPPKKPDHSNRPEMSEYQKEKIRESNRKRKGIRYNRPNVVE